MAGRGSQLDRRSTFAGPCHDGVNRGHVLGAEPREIADRELPGIGASGCGTGAGRAELDRAGILLRSVLQLPEPSMGSEDFAWFAEEVPSAHLRIGSKIDGLDTAIHRSNYDCNELAIPVGVRVLTRAALDLT